MAALGTLAFLALVGICSSETADCSYISLLKHLNLTTSNDILAVMRPVKNWTTPTLVQMDLVLFGILEVDEKSQTVTSHVLIQMRWKNEFLTWNSSDFCGIDKLTVPRSWLWIPDVNIQEDASDTGSIQNSPVVSLSLDGWLLSNARQRLTSTCKLNLNLFPFDAQNCTITFTSMNSGVESIVLGTVYSDTTLTEVSELIMVTKGEWELKQLQIITYSDEFNAHQTRLTYVVTISRKPLLYVINLIVPLLYFLILDLASFFISEARGEKLSFKVTVLLSISVLLLILKDMLPSTEDRLPMIATYCVAIFALVGLSVLETMLVIFLIDLDDYDYCCKKPQRSANAQQEDIQLEVNYHTKPAGAEETPEKSDVPVDWPKSHNLLKLILEEVKAARQEVEGQDRDKRKPGRYERVAKIIDSVFFTLYFLVVVNFLSYMNIVWIVQMY